MSAREKTRKKTRKEPRSPLPARPRTRPVRARPARAREMAALERDLARAAKAVGGRVPKILDGPPRWNADPDDVQRSVARLVLSLVEFVRKLLERQAIRRMEEGSLSEEEIERVGVALQKLEKTLHGMAKRFGLRPEELNLDLGPLGRLH